MEKINEENEMLALIPASVYDTTPIYKEYTPILHQILHTQNTKETEEQETLNTKKSEEWEMSILPNFLHIVTCYRTIIKTEHINSFIDYVKDECHHIDSMGLDGFCILQNIKRKMQRFLEYTEQNNDFVHQNLDWFQQRLFDIYVTSNPYSHKNTEVPKVTTKFRPLCPVVSREAKIEESDETFDNTISDIVVIDGGVVTYSHHSMTISCMTRDGDRNDVCCQSLVTNFTRIAQNMVLATLPFRKRILLVGPTCFKVKRIQLGLHLVSYLEHSTLLGVEMFGQTIYEIDWEHDRIKSKFMTKEDPSDIAVGAQKVLLITFPSTNRVICYTLDGQQLWVAETHSLHLPSKISLYQNYFFVLQGQIIYKISPKGDTTTRDIGRKCRSLSVVKDTILVTDYCGTPHAIETNKDFWPKMSYNHQLHTPSLKDHIHIEDGNKITNIIPMSTSSFLIIYRNKKVILFSDTSEIINQNNLTFLEIPSFCCRINSNRFLAFYPKMKGFQYFTCPELIKGPLIKVQNDYIKICHMVSNKYLALTTSNYKTEVHILLLEEHKIDIIERISLPHYNGTIATTPINFLVVDGRENKMIFYSTSGEELFQKSLPFHGSTHHICSDNLYFYVLFKKQSILICYDIYGEIKWQWRLPFPVHPHIAVFQGTIYVPDLELSRVLLYKCDGWSSGCSLHTKNPYIRSLNIRLKEKNNDKVVIAEICHLPDGHLVVSDIDHDCLLYISKGGDIVSRFSLPSTATDICRWGSSHIAVTLPLEKQLRVIGNSSRTVRCVSLSQPYVRVCKMGEAGIVCYCDKPSHLDILAIKNDNQVEIIKRINFPLLVKSLSTDEKTLKLLIVTRIKVFQYNARLAGGGRGGKRLRQRQRQQQRQHRLCSIEMVPSVLMSQVKHPPNLYGGSIDPMFVYLADNSRMFAINDHNLLVNDLVTSNQLNIYIDRVDVFSRNISVSEMLSSTLYLHDQTVSDKARHIPIPKHLGDKNPVEIKHLVITENNLIAGWDKKNKNIKIFTFDGQLLDSIKLNFYGFMKMCRWQSNTLVITNTDYSGNKHQLLALKVEFPLSLVIYQTRHKYKCIASLSNNQLVCSKWRDGCRLYFVDIDEIQSRVNEIKQMDIPESLLMRDEDGSNYDDILDIKVSADDDDVTVYNTRFIIFFNSDGQYLHSVRHYMKYCIVDERITSDDNYLYLYGEWDKHLGAGKYQNILCLTQTGEYERILLNKRMYKDGISLSSINSKGPRFVGSQWNELYVEGYFMVNRESFPVSCLQTDGFPVQVKDIDISDEGKTIVCEKTNKGNVKIFDEYGELLCHRNVATLVGGVCFTETKDIMATAPKRKQIFQLNGKDLQTSKVWETLIPYGVIWRKVGDIYWCVHIEGIECHCIKIDGDRVNLLESVPLSNLDSGLRFPLITSQMNEEIFGDEFINELKNTGGGGGDGGRSGKSGEIIGKGRLKVRCGNYIAESESGIDEISVRRLPHRTTMVPFSIPAFEEPLNYDFMDIRDRNSKLIKLDENVSVLLFRDTVTLIRTTTGDILQHEQLQQPPLDMCWWRDDCFIVAFGREMMVFNRDLRRLKTIRTEKYYNRIYKYNDNQLVCGGHYIRDMTEEERRVKCQRIKYNNKDYYVCIDCDAYDSHYVDVVDMKDGECKEEVCRRKTGRYGRLEGDAVVDDVGVTSVGDVVVVWREKDSELPGALCVVEWFREELLVRRIRIKGRYYGGKYYIQRPRLTTIGECVYITDRDNNIFQIPGHGEQQTFEDIKISTFKDNLKYLLLSEDDNEVFEVLGFDVSENSLMVFGIIPGRQPFAFFHYDK